ncbi:aminopeptidase [Natronobacterium texcoconense]|uniref:Aminopeptidase n=1 Tax=Natronobacterium texcoconense TaxID=1095778 RepID=A0A1H1AU46_NATTX|nr:aminopeptidase [Natronobacterium texcoconense]SDQ43213.1 aminopeptidase [Natronobacterium texcoconense]
MDERIRRHAEILVDYCTDVGPEDDVLVRAPTVAEDLVVALYAELGARGARPRTEWLNWRAKRAYDRTIEPDDYRTANHDLAAMAETDVVILIKAARNAAEGSDVDGETKAAASRARKPVLEQRLETRWVITQHPAPAGAQRAEMSTAGWADYVYDAIDRDWEAQRERQRQLVEILEPAEEVRIRSGETTDLRLSISGMGTLNDAGEENMPGGEVATSPVPDSVDGEIAFDVPLFRNSREIRDVRLEFEDGVVVDYEASRNEAALESMLETDDGARRVGELGFGMNRGIERATNNVLFDEKMGDTLHIALGNAMEECVPEDQPFNESAIHADLIVDVGEESVVEVDGDVIQRNGDFRFEEGFDAAGAT